ncbi:MAG: hypothetical protein NTV49_13550 [Kiritimatiellaeota bacterium]|nr:hypothetical protein [Kiritimatiellota bacterium]
MSDFIKIMSAGLQNRAATTLMTAGATPAARRHLGALNARLDEAAGGR